MNYKKASEKLKKTVAEKANEIIKKMLELEINGRDGGILVDGVHLKTEKRKSNVGEIDILTFGDDPGDLSSSSSSATAEYYFLHRDFDARIYYAHPRTFLMFANSWSKIKEEMAKTEGYLASKMEEATRKME